MPYLNHADSPLHVYRRARPLDFNEVDLENGKWSPNPRLFIPDKEGKGLSVFSADMTSPFAVLYHFIHCAKSMANSEDPKERRRGEKHLEKTPTVSAMLDVGWRIVDFPICLLPAPIFTCGEVVGEGIERGHFEVFGAKRDFELYSLTLREPRVTVLTPEECIDIDNIVIEYESE